MPIKCLIIDDEKLARDLLTDYLQKVPDLELVDTCSNALSAQSALSLHDIDLIFLDIQMPHLSGIDFLKTLRHPPLVILTTAYSEYALEAFDFDVVDYLLKPIVFERFFQAIGKVRNRLSISPVPTPINVQETPIDKPDFIFIKADNLIHKIAFQDILYIESLREYVRIHTQDKRIVFRQALSELVHELPATQFTRIHRSYIINIHHINNIEGNMVRIGQVTLAISKRKKEGFLDLLQKKGLIG
jgi:DNA-binding LytR/AlgR family response regulator